MGRFGKLVTVRSFWIPPGSRTRSRARLRTGSSVLVLIVVPNCSYPFKCLGQLVSAANLVVRSTMMATSRRLHHAREEVRRN